MNPRPKPILCKATIFKTTALTPTVFELQFTTEPRVTYQAGHFASVLIPKAGPGGRDLRRAYSIASSPDTDHLELCIKKVEGGPGTTYLNSLKTGDSFQCQLPFGDFLLKTQPLKNLVFIATGTGIAPFRSMMKETSFDSKKYASVHCLFGIREESEALYLSDLTSVPELNLVYCITRLNSMNHPGATFYAGRVTQYLKEKLSPSISWNQTDFYLCGNGEMIKECTEYLTQQGVEKTSIITEKYY